MNLYQHIGVAVTFSPRLHPLLAEAAYHSARFEKGPSIIHAGRHSLEKDDQIKHTLRKVDLPEETPIYWVGDRPAEDAILHAVKQYDIDLLIAGALEKEKAFRYYLGSVARGLVRHAPCSLLLLTRPNTEPQPFRRIVMVTDYSEAAAIALARTLRLAAREEAQQIYVLRILSTYGEAMILSEGVSRERRRHYQEHNREEELAMLHDFVDAAGRSPTEIEPVLLEGHPGSTTCQFVNQHEADLLVMPSLQSHHSHFFERLFPSQMEWLLREIPCPLWIARESLA